MTLTLLSWSSIATLQAQPPRYSYRSSNDVRVDYIERYKDIAIEQMYQYGIPASITLAQGILESGAGQSPLSQNSNNHFGIKCGSSWTGKTYSHFDDGRMSCFRVYDNPEESYRDHSMFLQRDRYKSLYEYDRTDYRSWAHGLKRCGYATSSTYANRLIDIIERYNLSQYDTASKPKKQKKVEKPMVQVQKVEKTAMNPFIVDGKTWHKVQPGETMASIADRYKLRLKKLYKLNHLDKDYDLKVGDLLMVHK